MKLLLLISFLAFAHQPPKWTYIVFVRTKVEHRGMPMYDLKGKRVNPYDYDSVWTKFPDSLSADLFFRKNIDKRDGLIYFHGAHVDKVWIDKIPRK